MAIRANGVERVSTREAGIAVRETTSQDLSSGSLNFTTSFNEKVKIKAILAHFTADPDKRDFIVKFDSKDGSNYDTILRSTDVKGIFDVFYDFGDGGFPLEKGDELNISIDNTGTPTSTVYVTVIGETA